MKKLIVILGITLSIMSFANAAEVLTCTEVEFSGDENGIAAQWPETIEVTKINNEKFMVSAVDRNSDIVIKKTFTNTYRDYIGYSNFRTNYFGEAKRVGTFFIGNGPETGKAFYQASSGCRGGYLSGCSSSGRKDYSCR